MNFFKNNFIRKSPKAQKPKSPKAQKPNYLYLTGFCTILLFSTNINAEITTNTGLFAGVSPIPIDPIGINRDIFIGRHNIINGLVSVPLDGELTVDSLPGPTALTTNNPVYIGIAPRSKGILNVIGNGSADSASFSSESSILVGGTALTNSNLFVPFSNQAISGEGEINVFNGGKLTAGSLQIGDVRQFSDSTRNFDNNGSDELDGVVNVDGVNSRLNADIIILGDSTVGTSGALNVTNGGRVLVKDTIDLGDGTLLPPDNIQGLLVVRNGAVNVNEGKVTVPTLVIGNVRQFTPIAVDNDSTQNLDNNGTNELDGVVNINGVNSILDANFVLIGDSTVGTSGALNVTNGGRVLVKDTIDLGDEIPVPSGIVNISENSRVTVDGEGSILSSDKLSVGTRNFDESPNPDNNQGLLEIRNGAYVEVSGGGFSDFGSAGVNIGVGAKGKVIVNGAGSELDIKLDQSDRFSGSLSIGSIHENLNSNTDPLILIAGSGELIVEDQAKVTVENDIYIGGNQIKVSELVGSTLAEGRTIPNTTGLLFVNSGAEISAQNIYVDVNGELRDSGGTIHGNVFVNNKGVLNAAGGTVDGDIRVAGGAFNVAESTIFEASFIEVAESTITGSTGVFSIQNGSEVFAQAVFLFEGSVLNGNGGILRSDLIVNGGTVSPGNSPGILTIDGNLELIAGMLDIEIGGTGIGEFDILNVTGDFIFEDGFDLNITFLNNFLPQQGDTFDFLNIAGDLLGDLSLINLIFNSAPDDLDFRLDLNGGDFSIASIEKVASVPAPSTVILFALGMIAFMNRKVIKNVSVDNRVAKGISPSAPTTPCMRLRTGRFINRSDT